jgi:predicted MFS family arabinose efflux permease
MLSTQFSKLDPEGTLSLCIISFMGTVGLSALMLLPLMVGAYVDYLGFGEDTAGWISGINLAGIAFMTLIVSLKTKRWPLERVAGYGLAAMIVFDLLSIFYTNLYALSAFRFLSGMGGGAVQAAIAAAIARLAHSDRGFGIYIGFQFLLPALGFYVLPGILPDIGFKGLMQILVGLEVFLLLFTAALANYRLPPATESGQEKVEFRLMIQPAALLSIIALCIYGAANAGIYAYAERIGLHTGMSGQATGNALSIANVLAVLGALLVVWLQDKHGHIKPLTAGIACQVIAMLVLVYNPTVAGYWVGFTIWSVAWAFSWPYFLSMQADLDSSGTVVVGGQFSNLVGNSMGPTMAAFLVSDGTYTAVIWLTCGLFILSLLPMYLVSRHLPSGKSKTC